MARIFVRDLLKQYGLRPRKGMGQHFLVNEEALSWIAQAARLTPDDVVVEVGPGLGSLTALLAEQAHEVVAVELDRDIAAVLPRILGAYSNVRVVQGNILEVYLEQELATAWRPPHSPGVSYKVVANLPYYISTPVLRYFFSQRRRPSLLVVTVQEEVAQRMLAAPPDMNFLAVLVQFYGRPEIVRRLPASFFHPAPKVDSAVVRIEMKDTPPLPAEETKRFFRVVSAGFAQRRKQIHNSLANQLMLPVPAVSAALAAAGVDGMRRAETLTIDEWLRVKQALDHAGAQ